MALIPSNHHGNEIKPISTLPPPIISSYNDQIRPLLDAIDKLRTLKVMQEGIQLPTIVVVGDQSSGKSSVLESLAAINLPRGQDMCTRVPLIISLQNQPDQDSNPSLSLEYMGQVVETDELHVAEDIECATFQIAGDAKGVSNTPITLLVKKNGVPDLTMVDLPGITRVPVRGQPENIYDQIKEMIMEYINPEESIILNVLSATVDFSTCESIMLSQSVDKTGERTLAVVTKADMGPEGLLEKVTNDDVKIGLGYVCVRNRVGSESYEEARLEESRLFGSHPSLSKINKSIVGIPVLAHKLVQIQANIISKCLPNIVNQINDKLNANITEMNKMPKNLSSVAEAMAAFMDLMGEVKESLNKILIRGEYDEYPNDVQMHCTARLAEKLNRYSDELQCEEDESSSEFLVEEVRVLEEAKGIGLPNFPPRSAFLTLLKRRVQSISSNPVNFVTEVWDYLEDVVRLVLNKHYDNYPQLVSSTKRATSNLITKMKDESLKHVMELIEMEKLVDYTCNPEYSSTWNRLMSCQERFGKIMENEFEQSLLEIEGFGLVNVAPLRKVKHVAQEALDMKMRMIAYWKIVLRRLVDWMALHLVFSIQKLVNKELVTEIVKDLMSPYVGGFERMLEEPTSVAAKRDKLNTSIKILKESKDVVSKIMDRIQIK